MSVLSPMQDLDNFCKVVAERYGLRVQDATGPRLHSKLTRLITQHSCRDIDDLRHRIDTCDDISFRNEVTEALISLDTVWFRDGAPWIAIRDRLVPELVETLRQNPNNKVRIWCAACSTGQEAYAMAMLIYDVVRVLPDGARLLSAFEILGTDVSQTALTIASMGRFDSITMGRGLVGEWRYYRQKYFRDVGRVSVIGSEIKRLVTFQRVNLMDSFSFLGQFNVVLLRNVVTYFTETFKRDLFDRVAKAIQQGGYLFLGAAESMGNHGNRFLTQGHGKALFYRLIKS